MSTTAQLLIFVVAAAASLATSWVLVTRLERLGKRFGLSEALLGLVAALAADAPEVTSAVTALAHGQRDVGAGVVIGSNLFNLAALLGLAAIVARRIALHRRVVLLAGGVAVWISLVCLVTITGHVGAPGGLALSFVVFVPYVIVLGLHRRGLRGRLVPDRWARWLEAAVEEEEEELDPALDLTRGTPRDAVVAVIALLVVVGASVLMERSATDLGTHFQVPGLIIGGVVLAAVTSLPNAVAAVYLARRGRGTATLSTALNSNSLNVLAGLMIPAVIMGLPAATGATAMIAWWYVALTAVALILAYVQRGLRRPAGWLIVACYAAFVASLFAVT